MIMTFSFLLTIYVLLKFEIPAINVFLMTEIPKEFPPLSPYSPSNIFF